MYPGLWHPFWFGKVPEENKERIYGKKKHKKNERNKELFLKLIIISKIEVNPLIFYLHSALIECYT